MDGDGESKSTKATVVDGLSFHPGHRQVYEEEAEHPGPKGDYICLVASRAYRTQPTSGITSPGASESFTAETNYSGCGACAVSIDRAIGTSFDVVQAVTGDTTYSRTRPQLEEYAPRAQIRTRYGLPTTLPDLRPSRASS